MVGHRLVTNKVLILFKWGATCNITIAHPPLPKPPTSAAVLARVTFGVRFFFQTEVVVIVLSSSLSL